MKIVIRHITDNDSWGLPVVGTPYNLRTAQYADLGSAIIDAWHRFPKAELFVDRRRLGDTAKVNLERVEVKRDQ